MRRAGRPPTIHDVARQAMVSVGTVSHVLNGKQKVSEERRQRVLAAADAIGYRPNGLARGLRARRSGVIGLSVPATSSAYHAGLAEAFEEIAAAEGHVMMQVMSRGSPDLEHARIEALLGRQVDGLLIVPSVDPQRSLDLVARAHLPAVIVGRIPDDPRFDSIAIDDRMAMHAAVRHLRELGHRRLLYIVRNPALLVTSTRIAALHEVAAGLEVAVEVYGDDRPRLERELPRLLRSPGAPTGLIASNSILAHWALHALHAHGLTWPGDLSIISFDEPVWGELLTPPLSVIRQPVPDLARQAWDMLMSRRDGFDGPARHPLLPVDIVARGSTARRG